MTKALLRESVTTVQFDTIPKMTCKEIHEKTSRQTNGRKLNLKIGLTKGQKSSKKSRRNYLLDYRNSLSPNQNSKLIDDESSSHLIETEFKILQSLIPGISKQPNISEVNKYLFLD